MKFIQKVTPSIVASIAGLLILVDVFFLSNKNQYHHELFIFAFLVLSYSGIIIVRKKELNFGFFALKDKAAIFYGYLISIFGLFGFVWFIYYFLVMKK
jgi:hypothetical protein